MDLRLLKKYFEDQCSSDEAREVLQWIEQTESAEELEDQIKEVWQNIKVKPGDYNRWSDKLGKIHEQIAMETLYDSLGMDKRKDSPRISGDRPAISRQLRQKYKGRRYLMFSIFGIAALAVIGFMLNYYLTLSTELVEVNPLFVQEVKSTERGQKLSFHLEDGTKVLLNSNSRIIYPEKFDSLERKVMLEGEAFFEVSEDNKRPFKVVTESIITTALGTSFNINSFTSSNKIEVSLVSGKVSIKSNSSAKQAHTVILNPGEMAIFSKNESSLKKSSFNFQEKIAWRDGIIFFNDASYKEVLERLENWYDVDIVANHRPGKRWEFSGKFENETLENILVALQFGHDFEFTINGKDVKLTF